MQPHFSIPPLTEEGVQKLVGQRCAVQQKNNSAKVWWVTIVSATFINGRDAIVEVSGHRKFGSRRAVALSYVCWPNHIHDPFIASIAKARGERRAA